MTLSDKAIQDLRIALRKSYGDDFDVDLSDEEIKGIAAYFADIKTSDEPFDAAQRRLR